MATVPVVLTQNPSPKYSQNLFHRFAELNDPYSGWNIVNGNGTVTMSDEQSYNGTLSMKVRTNEANTPLVFDSANDGFKFIAPRTGTYIFSLRLFVPSAYSFNEVGFVINGFINGRGASGAQFPFNTTDSAIEYDKWITIFQYLNLNAEDEYDLSFEFYASASNVFAYFDAFKMELDDRNLGIPSRYTFAMPIEKTATVTIPAVDSNDTEFVNVTFDGAEVGDYIQVVLPTQMATSELILGLPIVSASNTIRLSFHNHKGSATTAIPDTTFKFKIVK